MEPRLPDLTENRIKIVSRTIEIGLAASVQDELHPIRECPLHPPEVGDP